MSSSAFSPRSTAATKGIAHRAERHAAPRMPPLTGNSAASTARDALLFIRLTFKKASQRQPMVEALDRGDKTHPTAIA